MASATGSHPDTGSSVRPLPGSSTTIRPAVGRRFSAPKMPLLTERGFVLRRVRSPFDPPGQLARAPSSDVVLGGGRTVSHPWCEDWRHAGADVNHGEMIRG